MQKLSSELGKFLKEKNLSLTCAESCTGGLLGQVITSVPGSSEWFESGFITYSYRAKVNILGVNQKDLEKYGAVSEEIVKQMAIGAIEKSEADVGVAVSGIAGPAGRTDSKPVGTVCFAWKINNSELVTSTELFSGDRNQVRYSSVKRALLGTIYLLRSF
jgi:nicotinamide-nucleotide amidase